MRRCAALDQGTEEVKVDEQVAGMDLTKIPTLKPAFKKEVRPPIGNNRVRYASSCPCC
jgi:hypothetical protein